MIFNGDMENNKIPYGEGIVVATLDAEMRATGDWVDLIVDKTKLNIGWGYHKGETKVLYYGDVKNIKKVNEAVEKFASSLDGKVL